MGKTYEGVCSTCGKWYKGAGKYYCSRTCLFESLRGESKVREGEHQLRTGGLQSFIPEYEDIEVIHKNEVLVAGDFHLPCVDIDMLEKLISVAELVLKPPRTLCIVGDLVDFEAISFFGTRNKEAHPEIDIESARVTLSILFNIFDEIYLSLGNHEDRLLRKLDWFFSSHMLGQLITSSDKLRVTSYPYIRVISNDVPFHCTHPKAYSRLGSATTALAQKHRMTVLGFHGHLFSMRPEPSGVDIGYDVGCMTDSKLHSYIRHCDTTHPNWTCGFAIIKDGSVLPFSNNDVLTNWNFWLNQLPEQLKNGRLW